jgi:mannose-6-phosphate isomerase-like protein (cupin superfamily)
MTKNPPHAGEMHPDGDELLYLVDGAVDIILDEAAGERCLGLQPGQAFVVPCGVWHRVMVKEPCRLCILRRSAAESAGTAQTVPEQNQNDALRIRTVPSARQL